MGGLPCRRAFSTRLRIIRRISIGSPRTITGIPSTQQSSYRIGEIPDSVDDANALKTCRSFISETAKILTDIINTKRSLRLEVIIVVLIAFEIIIMAYQIMMR
jgi:required for meiotic nuclear division protein 1